MEKVLKDTDNYFFTTTTDTLVNNDDFVMEFISVEKEHQGIFQVPVKIKNLDELVDFLEARNWE